MHHDPYNEHHHLPNANLVLHSSSTRKMAEIPKECSLAAPEEILRLAAIRSIKLRPDSSLVRILTQHNIYESVPAELTDAAAEVLIFLQHLEASAG